MQDDQESSESASGTGTTGANPPASGPGGQSPSRDNAELLKQYRQIAREEAEKVAQSTKDKRIGQLERNFADWSPVLEKVKAVTGMSDAQVSEVQGQLELEEIKRRVLGNGQPQTNNALSGGTGNGDVAAEAVKGVVEELGLTLEDSEVAGIINQRLPLAKTVAALAGLQGKRNSAPEPNAAALAAPVGGQPPAPNLQGDYEKERDALMKNTRPGDERITKFTALKAKYRAKGLNLN